MSILFIITMLVSFVKYVYGLYLPLYFMILFSTRPHQYNIFKCHNSKQMALLVVSIINIGQ